MAISGRRNARQDTGVAAEAGELEDFARSLGADIYGVASAEAYGREFPDKPQPGRYVPDARSVIVIGMPMSPELWATVSSMRRMDVARREADEGARPGGRRSGGTERYFVDPEQNMLTNELMKMAYKISRKLHSQEHKAFYFHPFKFEPRFKTPAFQFMPSMHLAGIGQMGLNCSIITPDYGPRIWVTSIITDKDLPAGQPLRPAMYEDCQGCRICVERCPSRSLDGEGWKNVHGCSSYGCCGTCLSVCPAGIA